jgi:hypothetical protein
MTFGKPESLKVPCLMMINVLTTLINTLNKNRPDIEKYNHLSKLLMSKELIFSETVASIIVPDEIISFITSEVSDEVTSPEILKTFRTGISIDSSKIPIRKILFLR